MEFQEFLTKYNIKLDKKIYVACQDGEKIMQKSKDPHHSVYHINCFFNELDNFLENERTIDKNNLNFNIISPAVYWHDVWKSTREQTTNIFGLIYDQLRDGRGSMNMFIKYAKEKALSKEQTNEISYCILKHAQISNFFGMQKWFSLKTMESKILRDIDELDAWSSNRFENLKREYLEKKDLKDPRLIKIAKWWFSNMIKKAKPENFIFPYSQKKFIKRKKKRIQAIYDLWNNRHKYIEKSNSRIKEVADGFLER